jgi:hypothetical protein
MRGRFALSESNEAAAVLFFDNRCRPLLSSTKPAMKITKSARTTRLRGEYSGPCDDEIRLSKSIEIFFLNRALSRKACRARVASRLSRGRDVASKLDMQGRCILIAHRTSDRTTRPNGGKLHEMKLGRNRAQCQANPWRFLPSGDSYCRSVLSSHLQDQPRCCTFT